MPSLRTVSTLLACGLAPLQIAASGFEDLPYKSLLANPVRAKADTEFKAYLRGIAFVIKADYVCSERDDAMLRSPEAMIDEMVSFSNTVWGREYQLPVLGLGGIPNQVSAASVAFNIFTRHERCVPTPGAKVQ